MDRGGPNKKCRLARPGCERLKDHNEFAWTWNQAEARQVLGVNFAVFSSQINFTSKIEILNLTGVRFVYILVARGRGIETSPNNTLTAHGSVLVIIVCS